MMSEPEEDPPSNEVHSIFNVDEAERRYRSEMLINLQLIAKTYKDDAYLKELKKCMKRDKNDLKRVVHGVLLSEAVEGGIEPNMLKTKVTKIKGLADNSKLDKYVKENFDYETFFELLRNSPDEVIVNRNGWYEPVLDASNVDLYNDAKASVKHRDDKERRKDERLAKQLDNPDNVEEYYRGTNRVRAAIMQAYTNHSDKLNATAEISARTGTGETVIGINYNHFETEYEKLHGRKLALDVKKICGRSTLAKGLKLGQGPVCFIDAITMEEKKTECGANGMYIAIKNDSKDYTEDDIRKAKEEVLLRNASKQGAAKKWEEKDARRARDQLRRDTAQAREDEQSERKRLLQLQMQAIKNAAPAEVAASYRPKEQQQQPAAPPPPEHLPDTILASDLLPGTSPPPLEHFDPNMTGSSGELQAIASGIPPTSYAAAFPPLANQQREERVMPASIDAADDDFDDFPSETGEYSDDGDDIREEKRKANAKQKERRARKVVRAEDALIEKIAALPINQPAYHEEREEAARRMAAISDSATRVASGHGGTQERRNQWDERDSPVLQLQQPLQQQAPPPQPQPAPPAPPAVQPSAQEQQPAPTTSTAAPVQSSVFAPRRIPAEAYEQPQPPPMQQHQQPQAYGQEQQQYQLPHQQSPLPMQNYPPTTAAAPYGGQPQQQQLHYPPTSPPPPHGDVAPGVLAAPMHQQPLYSPVVPPHPQQYHHQQQQYAGQSGTASPMPYEQGATVSSSQYSQAPGGVPYGAAQPPYSAPTPQLQYSQQQMLAMQHGPPQAAAPPPLQPPAQSPVNVYVNNALPPPGSEYPQHPQYPPQQQQQQPGYYPPPPPAAHQQPQYPGQQYAPPLQQDTVAAAAGYRGQQVASPHDAALYRVASPVYPPQGPTPPPAAGGAAPHHYYGGAPPSHYAPQQQPQPDYGRRPLAVDGYGYGYDDRGATMAPSAPPGPSLPRRPQYPEDVYARDPPLDDRRYPMEQYPPQPQPQYRDDPPRGPPRDRRDYDYPPQEHYQHPHHHHHQQQQYQERRDPYAAPADPRYPVERHERQQERRPVVDPRDYEDQQRRRRDETTYAQPITVPHLPPRSSHHSPPPLEDWEPRDDPHYRSSSSRQAPPPHHPPLPMTSSASSTLRRSRDRDEQQQQRSGFGRADDAPGNVSRGFGRADEEARRGGGGRGGYDDYPPQPHHHQQPHPEDRGGAGFGRSDAPREPARRGDRSMEYAGRHQQQSQPAVYGSQRGTYQEPSPPRDDRRGGGYEYDNYGGRPQQQSQYDSRAPLAMDRPLDASTPINRSRDAEETLWSFFDKMNKPEHRIRWQVVSILKCVRDKNRERVQEGRSNEFELIEMEKMEFLIQKGCGNDFEAYDVTIMKYPNSQKPFYQLFKDMEKDGLLHIYIGSVRNEKLNSFSDVVYLMDPHYPPPDQFMLKRRNGNGG